MYAGAIQYCTQYCTQVQYTCTVFMNPVRNLHLVKNLHPRVEIVKNSPADDVTSIFLSDMSAIPTTNAQGEDVVTVTVGFQATVASGNAIEAIRFPDVAASDGEQITKIFA